MPRLLQLIAGLGVGVLSHVWFYYTKPMLPLVIDNSLVFKQA